MKKGRRKWPWAHSPGRGARWISIREAASFLSVSESGLRKMVDRDLVPVARVGRLIRVDLKLLNERLESQSQGVKGPR